MSMKAVFNVRDGLTVEVDIKDIKDVFKASTDFHEVFGDHKCGLCQSDDIRLNHRNVEGNDFYELVCNVRGCGGKLSYGQEKATNKIYPRRYETDPKGKALRDNDGKPKYLPNGGWHKYVPNK